MTDSLRPSNHGERARCSAAVARLEAWTGLHVALATLIATDFRAVSAGYEAARVSNDGAALKAAKATDDKAAAEDAFALAFKTWLYSAFTVAGQAKVLRELRPLMGNRSVSRFLTQPVWTRLEQMPRLDLYVRGLAWLTGDVSLLDRLRDATNVLEGLVTASDAANADWGRQSKALAELTPGFDRSYGALTRAIRAIDPKGAGAELPVFHHRPPAEPVTAADPDPQVAAEAPAAEAPSPEAPISDAPVDATPDAEAA